jgi:hypothetical protein
LMGRLVGERGMAGDLGDGRIRMLGRGGRKEMESLD